MGSKETTKVKQEEPALDVNLESDDRDGFEVDLKLSADSEDKGPDAEQVAEGSAAELVSETGETTEVNPEAEGSSESKVDLPQETIQRMTDLFRTLEQAIASRPNLPRDLQQKFSEAGLQRLEPGKDSDVSENPGVRVNFQAQKFGDATMKCYENGWVVTTVADKTINFPPRDPNNAEAQQEPFVVEADGTRRPATAEERDQNIATIRGDGYTATQKADGTMQVQFNQPEPDGATAMTLLPPNPDGLKWCRQIPGEGDKPARDILRFDDQTTETVFENSDSDVTYVKQSQTGEILQAERDPYGDSLVGRLSGEERSQTLDQLLEEFQRPEKPELTTEARRKLEETLKSIANGEGSTPADSEKAAKALFVLGGKDALVRAGFDISNPERGGFFGINIFNGFGQDQSNTFAARSQNGTEFMFHTFTDGNTALVRSTRPDGSSLSTAFSSTGEIAGTREKLVESGGARNLDRDREGNLTEMERPNATKLKIERDGERATAVQDGHGKSFSRQPDGSWRREDGTKVDGELVVNDDFSYSFVSEKTELTIHDDGSETLIDKETGFKKEQFADGRVIETDGDGNITRTVAANGDEKNFEYENGKLARYRDGNVEWELKDGKWKGSNGQEFDGERRVGEHGELIERKNGENSTKAYELDGSTKTRDGEGRIKETVSATGDQTRYEYRDGQLQPYKVTYGSNPGHTWMSVNNDNTRWVSLDANGKPTNRFTDQTLTLDEHGNRTETFTSSEGNRSYTAFTDGSQIDRNRDGNISKLTTPDKKEYKFDYNSSGSLSQVTRPDGSVSSFDGNWNIDQKTGTYHELTKDRMYRMEIKSTGIRSYSDIGSGNIFRRKTERGEDWNRYDKDQKLESVSRINPDKSEFVYQRDSLGVFHQTSHRNRADNGGFISSHFSESGEFTGSIEYTSDTPDRHILTRDADNKVTEVGRPNDTKLGITYDGNTPVQIDDGNGKYFKRNPDGSWTREFSGETFRGEFRLNDDHSYSFVSDKMELTLNNDGSETYINKETGLTKNSFTDGRIIESDRDGKVTRTVDRKGVESRYHYDGDKLTSYTSGDIEWRMQVDGTWKSSTGETFSGERSVGENGALIERKTGETNTKAYELDNSTKLRDLEGRIIETTGASGLRTRYEYKNGQTQPYKMTLGSDPGNTYMAVNADNTRWAKLDQSGNPTAEYRNQTVTLDEDGNRTEKFTDTGNSYTRFTDGSRIVRNRGGNITELETAKGEKYKFEYHSAGFLLAVTRPDGSAASNGIERGWVNSDGSRVGGIGIDQKTGAFYDVPDDISTRLVVERNGTRILTDLNAHHLLERTGAFGAVRFTLDDHGQAETEELVEADESSVTRYRDSSIKELRRPDGYTVQFERNNEGVVTRINESSGASWVRNEDGSYTLEGTNETIYGELKIDDKGYEFHQANNEVVRKDLAGFSTVTDAQGIERLRINADGSRVLRDEHGQIDRTMDAAGRWRFFGRENGVLTTVQEPDGTQWQSEDGKHWLEVKTDGTAGARREGEYSFEADGTRVFKQSNGIERIEKSDGSSLIRKDGDVAEITDKSGRRWHFEYDEHHNPTKMTKPDGSQWEKTADGWRNKADGQTEKFTIDVKPDGSVTVSQEGQDTVTFQTDGWNHLTNENGKDVFTRTSGDGTSVTKNKFGLITEIQSTRGKSTFQYDEAGRMTSFTADGTTWTRDEDGKWSAPGKTPWEGSVQAFENGSMRWKSVSFDQTFKPDGSRINRDNEGRITTVQTPSGKTYEYTWNSDKLETITHPDGSVWTRKDDNTWEIKNGESVEGWQGQVALQEDGTLQKQDGESKALTTHLTNGITVESDQSGKVKHQTMADGSSVSFNEDGEVVYRESADGIKETLHQDGTKTKEFPDGTVMKYENDNIVELRTKDGTIRKYKWENGEVVEYTNGNKTLTRGKGNTWTSSQGGTFQGDIFPTEDGGHAIKTADGIKTWRRDGLNEMQHLDRSVTVRDSAGHITETRDINGKVRKFEWDGDRLSKVTLPDGNTWTRESGNHWVSSTGKTFDGVIEHIDDKGSYVYRYNNGNEDYYKSNGERVFVDYAAALKAYKAIDTACGGTWDGTSRDAIRQQLSGTSDEFRAMIDKIHREKNGGKGIEERLRAEDEPELIGLFMRDNDVQYWDEAEAAADAIERACNHGGFLWTGAGTDEEKIYEHLKNKPPEYRKLLNEIFQRKYGWQYGDSSYDLRAELQNEMSDYQLEKALSLFDNGEGDLAGRIRVAVLESDNSWFTETRNRDNCEQDVRDTIRSLTKEQLDDLRLTYKERHKVDLDEELFGSGSKLSEKTREALRLYVQAIDGKISKKDAAIGVGRLACQHEDLELFKEAFAETPQDWRTSFRNNTHYDTSGNSLGTGDELVKRAFEPRLWNALTLGFSGPVFSGRDLRHAESYAEHGKLSADVQIQDNTTWLGDSEKEIEETLHDMTESEREQYFLGKEIDARTNLNESSLSDDDVKALQYYRDVHGALEGAAGKWYSYGSGQAEMLKWEDMIRFQDGGILTQIAKHRGDAYDDNLNDVLHSIENMSAQDLDRFHSDPRYQQEVEKMLDNYLSDYDTERAMAILNKMASAQVDVSTLSEEGQRQFAHGQDISGKIARGELKESEIESQQDKADLDFYRKTFLEAAKEAGQRDFLTTLNDNLHWWDDKESNIYNAIQNMTLADRQKYATDSTYRQQIADALYSLDESERILAQSLLKKVEQNPSEKPQMDILEKFQLQATYWNGDEGKMLREVNKALLVDKSKFSEEQLAQYTRGEELRQAGRRPDDATLSKEDQEAIEFFREHNLRDRLLNPITAAEIEYRDTFIRTGRDAAGGSDFDNHIWKLVEGNYSFKDQLSWYNGIFNDSEVGVYEAIEMAGPNDWAALIADPAATLPFMNAEEREVALNIARQQGEFRVEDKLRSYMLGWGTSEAEIHQALQSLDAEGRERVKLAYATKYGTSLTSDLLNEMGGADGLKAMRRIRTEATTARGTWDDARDEYYTARQGAGNWLVDNMWDGSGFRADEAHFAFAAAMSQEGGISLEDAQMMSEDLYGAIDSLREGKLALAEFGADVGLALAAVACMFIPGGQAVTAAIAAKLGHVATKLPALARIAVQAMAKGVQASSHGMQMLMSMSRPGQVASAALTGGTYRSALIQTLTGDGADAEVVVQNFLAGAGDAATAFIAPQQIARLAGIGRVAGQEAVEGALTQIGKQGAKELLSETGETTLQEGMEALMREAMSTGNYKVSRKSLEELAARAAKDGLGEEGLKVLTEALETSLKDSMARQSQQALANLVRELSLNAPGGAVGGFTGGVVRINPDLSVEDNLNMIGLSTTVGGGAAMTFTLGFKGIAAGVPPTFELTKRGYRAVQRLAGTGDDVGDAVDTTIAGQASDAVDTPSTHPGDSPQDGSAPPRDSDAPPQNGEAPSQDGDAPSQDGDGPPQDGDAPPQDGIAPPRDRAAAQPRLKPTADVPSDGAYSPTIARPDGAELDAMSLETPALAKPVAEELSQRFGKVRDGWTEDLTPQAQRVRDLQPQVDSARAHLDAEIARLKANGASDADIAAARLDENHPLSKQSKLHELSEKWKEVADEHSALTKHINEVTQTRRDQLQAEINDFIKQHNLNNPDHPLPEPVTIQLAEHMHAAGGYDFGDGTIVLAKADLVGADGGAGLSRTTFHEIVHAQQDMDIIRRSIHETTDGGKLPMDIKKVQEHYKEATGKDLSERWLKSVAAQNQNAPTMTQPQLIRAKQLAAEVKASTPIADQSAELGNQARVLYAKAQDLRNPQDPQALNRLMKELSDPNSGPALAKHLFGDQIPPDVATMMKEWANLPKDENGLAKGFTTPAEAQSNLANQFDAHRDAVNAKHKQLVDDYAGTRLEKEAYGFDGNVREPHELPPTPRPTGDAPPQPVTPLRYTPEEVNGLDAASKQWKEIQDSLDNKDLGDGFNQDVKTVLERGADDPNLSDADKAALQKLIDDYRPDNPQGIKRVHDYLKGEHDAAFRPRASTDAQETLPSKPPSTEGERLVANMNGDEVDSYLKNLGIEDDLREDLVKYLFDEAAYPNFQFDGKLRWRREQLADLLDRLKTATDEDDRFMLAYSFMGNPLRYGAYMQNPELLSKSINDFVVIARGEEINSGNFEHWTDQFNTAVNYFLDKRRDNRHLHLVIIEKDKVSPEMWEWASQKGAPMDTTGKRNSHFVDPEAYNKPSGETEKILPEHLEDELKEKTDHYSIKLL